jgi:hypothetical protein
MYANTVLSLYLSDISAVAGAGRHTRRTDMDTNLARETVQELSALYMGPDDVEGVLYTVGGSRYCCTFQEFLAAAKEFDYDDGDGSVYVSPDICVLLKDRSWLERVSLDGNEWWMHRSPPSLAGARARIPSQRDLQFERL